MLVKTLKIVLPTCFAIFIYNTNFENNLDILNSCYKNIKFTCKIKENQKY